MFARTLAFLIGSLGTANVVGGAVFRELDANIWWIDARWLPGLLAATLILVGAIGLVGWSIRPGMSCPRRFLTCGSIALLILLALSNSIAFWTLSARGAIRSTIPIPLSLLVVAVLSYVFIEMLRDRVPTAGLARQCFGVGVAVTLVAVGFPLAQMFLFGKTDYSRSADAIVVLGARTYADGRPSDALADRVRTACALYRRGLAPIIIMSGGRGDGAVHETEAMRNMAIELGVPASAILLDREGINTRATATNVSKVLRVRGAASALAVSHFYHLPRVKLAFARAGFNVFTVPATESYTLRKMPLMIAREVVAQWAYLFLPRSE